MFRREKTSGNFSEQAQVALQLALVEAQQLQHDYVGTEHVLLGLMKEPSGLAASVLNTFRVDAAMVQAEVEKLVQRGAKPVTLPQPPYTPRATLALAFAAEEAWFWNQKTIGPEHLLLGLLREPEGVAGQALRNLGLVFGDVAREVVKTRRAQMQVVERAVRPVRATTAHKRKMREELLAHLTAIYDDEFARSRNSTAGLHEAQKRFGEPAELARELDAVVPLNERIGYHFKRWLAWRAPESAARYVWRQAKLSFCLLAAACRGDRRRNRASGRVGATGLANRGAGPDCVFAPDARRAIRAGTAVLQNARCTLWPALGEEIAGARGCVCRAERDGFVRGQRSIHSRIGVGDDARCGIAASVGLRRRRYRSCPARASKPERSAGNS